jgi:hypothetical protein
MISEAVVPKQGIGNLTQVVDLRHRVRRVRWFRETFKQQADEIGRRFQFRYRVDERGLVSAFFRWAKAFESQRAAGRRNRRDFAVFAAGLMLRELCQSNPAHRVGAGQFDNLIPPEPMAGICEFWPEGYLYATYCMRLVRAILVQDFAEDVPDNPLLTDVRVWQSFRENFKDNPSTAIGFFDLFMGVEPNWSFPENFGRRPGARAPRLAAEQDA